MTLMRGSRFRTGWSFGFAEDLQFFGHTHAGQFFPLRLLYPLFTQTCGEYECDGAKLYVSAGAGGWCIPFRTEAPCRFEVVDLFPAEG